MKLTQIMVAGVFLICGTTANASLVSVTGPVSSTGTLAAIIGAPLNALNSTVFNTGMEGFDEAQGVTTTMAYTTDTGVIAAGTLVDSHMIFLNREDGIGGPNLTHQNVEWTFSGDILGVMSDSTGSLEVASTGELGAALTNYPAVAFNARGMEDHPNNVSGDGYLILGALNVMRVSMFVSQPGDWIRVITASASVVPVPAAVWLFGTALIGFVGMSRRRKVS